MHARLITRTHYQVDEPAYLRTLIGKCTSPVRSCSREAAATKLTREYATSGSINIAAAGYAVDLARATGLIGDNQLWTERGHVLAQIAASEKSAESFELTPQEIVFFLRLFMEVDGAAMVYFMSLLAAEGTLPGRGKDWNALANDLFIWTFRSYADISTDVAERIKYRQLIQNRQSRPFSGAHSGDHQCFLHLQTLFRLLLVGRESNANSRQYYSLATRDAGATELFVSRLSTVRKLEEGVQSQVWWQILDRLIPHRISESKESSERDLEQIKTKVVGIYRRITSSGVPLCPLRTLFELLQIGEFLSSLQPRDFSEQLEDLKSLQRAHPRKVHFHVDRIGRPAFVKLDASLLRETA